MKVELKQIIENLNPMFQKKNQNNVNAEDFLLFIINKFW